MLPISHLKQLNSLRAQHILLGLIFSCLVACHPENTPSQVLPQSSPSASASPMISQPSPSPGASVGTLPSLTPRVCVRTESDSTSNCEPQPHPQEVFFLSNQAQVLSEQGYELLKQNRCSESHLFFQLAYEQEKSMVGQGYLSMQINQTKACEQKQLSFELASLDSVNPMTQTYAVEYVINHPQVRAQVQKGHDALQQGECAQAIISYTTALFEVDKGQVQSFLEQQRQSARRCLEMATSEREDELTSVSPVALETQPEPPATSTHLINTPQVQTSNSPEPTPTMEAKPSPTPTASQEVTASPEPTPTMEAKPTPTPTASHEAIASPEPTPTSTAENLPALCSEGPGKLRWKQTVSGELRFQPVLGQNGNIYIFQFGGSGYELLALNPEGQLVWTYPIQQRVSSSPAVAPDGSIVFGTQEGWVYAIQANGQIKWIYKTGQTLTPQSPTIAQDGTISLVTGTRLFTLNANGTLKNQFQGVAGRPIIGPDGTLYRPEEKTNLSAFAADGKLKWKVSLTETTTWAQTVYHMSIDEQGILYISNVWNNKRQLYAVNTKDGSVLWQIPLPSYLYAVLIDQNQLYLTNVSSKTLFRALNKQTQIEKWMWNQVSVAPFLQGAGGTLFGTFYSSSLGFKILAFAPDGSVLWDYRDYDNLIAGHVTGSALASNGSLYTAYKNTFYAVCTGSQGLNNGPWPSVGKDSQNSGRY